jgi:hypothetical protein
MKTLRNDRMGNRASNTRSRREHSVNDGKAGFGMACASSENKMPHEGCVVCTVLHTLANWEERLILRAKGAV